MAPMPTSAAVVTVGPLQHAPPMTDQALVAGARVMTLVPSRVDAGTARVVVDLLSRGTAGQVVHLPGR